MRRKLKESNRIDEWHRYFAWHPVITLEGWFVWLETVERKWGDSLCGGSWDYRLRRKL